MKNIVLACLIFFSSYSLIKAQCATEPLDSLSFVNQLWFANNAYLVNLVDSIEQLLPPPGGEIFKSPDVQNAVGGFDKQSIFWVPLKVFVYNDNSGSGGLNPVQVERAVRSLNDYFRGTRMSGINQFGSHSHVQFYLKCAVTYFDNNAMAFLHKDNDESVWENELETHYDYGAINVYFIQDETSGEAAGWVRNLPQENQDKYIYRTIIETQNNPQIGSTFPHEIGHVLGLSHTHNGRCWYSSVPNGSCGKDNKDVNNCRQESVSRSKQQGFLCFRDGNLKCEVNGDALCDTDADPLLDQSNNVNVTNGQYTGGGADNWGDPWTPPTTNIMSYSISNLRVNFTSNQIGVMYSNIIWNAGSGAHLLHYANPFVDIYEPDNSRRMIITSYPDNTPLTNELEFNVPQHRGLHNDINGNRGATNTYSYCDQDWTWFSVPSGGNVKVNIYTEAVPNRPQVDTEIFLIDATGQTVLTSNDDKAPGDPYSAISEYELSAGIYWVRIESRGNTAGEYHLTLERCAEECCFQDLIGSTNQISPSTGPFNLGLRIVGVEEYLGSILSVSDALFFHDASPLGFGTAGSSVSNSHLEAVICNDAEISIESGGQMVLGHPGTGRSADVHFTEGTSLRIKQGGKITVKDGSTLIIEDGANFTFEDGAQIQLNGPNAELVIEGKLTVGDNALFTFNGDGRLVFDQDIPWVAGEMDFTDFMDIGENTKFHLTGDMQNPSQVLLEVRNSTHLKDEQGNYFDEVRFEYMGMQLGADFSIYGTAFIHDVEVNQNATTHGGIRIWGIEGDSQVRYSKFSNGNPSIMGMGFGSHSVLNIENCEFVDNYSALKMYGGKFKVSACDFQQNDEDIEASGLNGTSFIHGSSFSGANGVSYSQEAVRLNGQNNSLLSIRHSDFDGYGKIIDSHGMDVDVKKSEFTNSHSAISAYNSTIYANEEACNQFYNLETALKVWGETAQCGLFLENGHNDFDHQNTSSIPSEKYIEVIVTSEWDWISDPNTSLLDADYNTFNTYNSHGNNSTHDYFLLEFEQNGNSITHTDVFNSNNAILSNCGSASPVEMEFPLAIRLNAFSSGCKVVLSDQGLTDLIEAISMGFDDISRGEEDIRNDLEALELLVEIQQADVENPDAATPSLLALARKGAFIALENSYHYEFLTHDEGEGNPKPPVVASFYQILDDEIAALSPADSADYFSAHLSKVHAFRSGGFYSDALSLLADRAGWTFSTEESLRSDYWNCVCEAESGYYSGNIPSEEFAYEIGQCNTNYAGYNYKTAPRSATEEPERSPQITTFPQPVGDFMRVQIRPWEKGQVSWYVRDLSGKTLLENKEQWSGNLQVLDMQKLQTGAYILSLEGNGFSENVKFIKK